MSRDRHDYRHTLIASFHDTPMQRKLRKLAPMPIGCVFLPWPGMTEAEARAEFRTMKALGFTCLKQTMGTVEWPTERTLGLALEEGIIPFWYAEGGYEDITPELLTRLGLPADMAIDDALVHPKMVAHQHALLRERIARGKKPKKKHEDPDRPKDKDWVPSVVGDVRGHELKTETIPFFVAWLKNKYGTLDALREAWNFRHVGIGGETGDMAGWKDWADVERDWITGFRLKDYAHILDALHFRAESYIQGWIAAPMRERYALDPQEPQRAGGEMGLFLSFASRGTDMEGIAHVMGAYGSFYPSIHLTWHFEEVAYEVARPIYMQASIAADWGKGIWTGPWESTGGPNYFSGGKAPFVEDARHTTPGFTCDAGTMTQLLLSYLAGGFRGIGLWTWNGRTAGWEAGEYAITDRNRQVGERARRIGAIGTAMKKWRRELWQANKEPYVGILADWDSDAMWAAMAVVGRDKYRAEPVRARIGASRALMDANVPWEYVTPWQLDQGLAPRYRVIYLPASIRLSRHLIEVLTSYVKQGGRVVMDMPSAYFDEGGVVFQTGQGSGFEQLFGGVLHEFGYSNGLEQRYHVDGVAIDGFTCLASATTARVACRFPHNGQPAVLEHRLGKGTATLLCWQGALTCYRPGREDVQELMVRHILGEHQLPYRCTGALCYRQSAPQADHWFLINPGQATVATLDPGLYAAEQFTDAVTGEAVDITCIALEGHSGRWLRAAK